MSNNFVWHYAPWSHLPSIVECGFLKVSNSRADNESKLLWFSLNQIWEPTATKLFQIHSGKFVQMTFSQQNSTFGCIRFGLPADDLRLLDLKQACIAAGIAREARRLLVQKGKRKGADPAHWFASTSNIPLSDVHLQVWSDVWCDTPSPHDMAADWIAKCKSRDAKIAEQHKGNLAPSFVSTVFAE